MLLRVLLILCIVVVMIIIAAHLDYQIGPSYLGLSKTSTSLRYIVNNSNTRISMTPNRSSQYIWCVNHYGPNNQLKDFVKCCIIAMINNYTLIIPPLFPHFADKIRGIQWFDHFYDVKQLSLVLNVVTLDEFISKKINKKRITIDCFLQQTKLAQNEMFVRNNTLSSIQDTYKINVTFHHHINLSRYFDMKDILNKGKNCSSIFLHIGYTRFGHLFHVPNNFHTQLIFKYLHRTPLIKRMASSLIKFLPQLISNKNQSQNQFHTLAVIHMRLGDYTAMNISTYIEKILYLIKIGVQFTHLYIMCPYLNPSDIKQLNESLSIPFITTQDLLSHVRSGFDEYLFDVLEQEIAFQAAIFFASPWTTYSATVMMQKVSQQQGTVYLLSREAEKQPFLVTKKNAMYFQ